MPSLLSLEGVVGGYGAAQVLNGVSLEVAEGEVAVILGANGVGKTTTLRTIMGFLKPWRGEIRFDGRRITPLEPEALVSLGLSLLPEPPAVFRDLTVVENLKLGAFSLGKGRRAEKRVEELLEAFPVLLERKEQLAGSLSGGEQRVLALARALAPRPRLLLVDEASMGLSPVMVEHVLSLVERVRREEGATVLMVEQNVSALDIADRAYVMEKGRVIHEARGDELPDARAEAARAYLGMRNTAPGRGAGR